MTSHNQNHNRQKAIPYENLILDSIFHKVLRDGTIEVDEEKDGKSLKDHIEGIKYFRKLIKKGEKLTPVLVVKEGAKYRVLDGFKRAMAYSFEGQDVPCLVFKSREKGRSFIFNNKPVFVQYGGMSYETWDDPTEQIE
jgi:hypothetical protein